MRLSILALGLTALVSCGAAIAAPASLEVKFLEPGKYRDAGERDEDRLLMQSTLGAHLKALVEKYLPAEQQLRVEVLDVDLAGEIWPPTRFLDRVRVMRSVSWPSIELHYSLSSGEQLLRQAKVSVRDMSYLDRINVYPDGDSLRYEKAMLDAWFRREFAVAGKP